jgi:hypothetical protein
MLEHRSPREARPGRACRARSAANVVPQQSAKDHDLR